MKRTVVEAIRHYLGEHGPARPDQVAAAIPELDEAGGPDRAYLLIRLDPLLESLPDGRWIAQMSAHPPAFSVREAVGSYFTGTGKQGETLIRLVQHVTEATGISGKSARSLISTQFVTNGTYVFNRRRDRSGG